MKHRICTVSFSVLACSLLLVCWFHADTQQAPANAPITQSPASGDQGSPKEEETSPGQVVIEDHGPILTVYESVGGRTPEQRATAIEQRIIALAREGTSVSVQLARHEGWTEIVIGGQLIMAVTDADAKFAGKPRDQLAAEYADNIARTIPIYRQEHSWRMILQGLIQTIFATIILASVVWLLRRVRSILGGRIENRIHTSVRLEQKSAWHLAVAYLGPVSLALGAIVHWLFVLSLLEAYLTIVLGFFSSTREISHTASAWVFTQLESLTVGARFAASTLIGQIEKLIRILILILACIIAFPYLPGAKSPAFQGISIFLGVLLSLGSSSAVANAIAGVILTYMRSFLVGDWVQIGETTGEVTDKNLLVTRVLTPKAEIITIPNATVMSGTVKNYSIEAKKSGVIFHTAVTIGYDAPWKTVHQLLIKAAFATEHVLQQPQPFVLQNKLDDFYVCYELNAYSDSPAQMLTIYSDLHQNIQDTFNEAGVEICSPHFSSLRDGNVIAIPHRYVAPDYQPPSFRVSTTETPDPSFAVSGKFGASRRTG